MEVFDGDMKQKEVHASIKNEADNGLKNTRGDFSDGAGLLILIQQQHNFFINYKDNAFLDYTSSTAQGWGYAVFAEVVEGMDVVDKMEKSSNWQYRWASGCAKREYCY